MIITEVSESLRTFFQGRKIVVTGHSGFKGGWLTLWLMDMGAEVYGYALAPPTEPSFCHVCQLEQAMAGFQRADLRDKETLCAFMRAVKPEIVFHLAAQPIVRRSYQSPVETYGANVMGTVHLLEAVRECPAIGAVVNVTTDKCYENREWVWAYRENDELGGCDPYSSSKAAAEMVIAAYRKSFFSDPGQARVASARAGNVIGGGDWGEDRLIPDFLRALDAGHPLQVRAPDAVRPWQHVLEPLSGYLMLAQGLYEGRHDLARPWNFGPDDRDTHSVGWMVDFLCSNMPGASWCCDENPQPHETSMLRVDSSLARCKLGWYPRWNTDVALKQTIAWHQAWRRKEDMNAHSLEQIHRYEAGRA